MRPSELLLLARAWPLAIATAVTIADREAMGHQSERAPPRLMRRPGSRLPDRLRRKAEQAAAGFYGKFRGLDACDLP